MPLVHLGLVAGLIVAAVVLVLVRAAKSRRVRGREPDPTRPSSPPDLAVDPPPDGPRARFTTGDRSVSGAVVECRSLTKRYEDVVAVDGVTFTLAAGTVTGFLGPNGAGKTT